MYEKDVKSPTFARPQPHQTLRPPRNLSVVAVQNSDFCTPKKKENFSLRAKVERVAAQQLVSLPKKR
jgi:hypothetical protein